MRVRRRHLEVHTHIKLESSAQMVSPYVEPHPDTEDDEEEIIFSLDDATLAKSFTSSSPVQPDTHPIVTPSTQESATTLPIDTHLDDRTLAPPSSPPLNPTATTYNTRWRQAPAPTGPWVHNGVARSVTFHTSPDTNTTPMVHGTPIGHASNMENTNHVPFTPHINGPTGSFSQYPPMSYNTSSYTNHGIDDRPSMNPSTHTHPHNDPTAPHLVVDYNDFGVMTEEQFFFELSQCPLDVKNFKKKDCVPIQGNTSLLNWYRRFTLHGIQHGVYIPPFESLTAGNKMGSWYCRLDHRIQPRVRTMSQTIHLAIVNSNALPPGPDLNRVLSTNCGYTALNSLMRTIHPRLSTVPFCKDPPRCRLNEDMTDYINRWTEYLPIEYENGQIWRRFELVRQIINHLPKVHVLWVKHHFESLMMAQGHRNCIPDAFTMDNIAYTIEKIIPENPSYQAPRPATFHPHHHQSDHRSHDRQPRDQRTSHAITTCVDDPPSDNESEPEYFIAHSSRHAEAMQCPICVSTTHNLVDCHKYIIYCLCSQYAQKHPSSIHDITRVHKQPPKLYRLPRSSNALALTAAATPDHDDPTSSPAPDAIVNSIMLHQLDDYHEDCSDDLDASDDASDNTNPIVSIGFDFDVYPHFRPLSTSPNTRLPDTVAVVHTAATSTTDHPTIGGQFDSGANMTTTNHLHLIWNLQPFKQAKYTVDAGQTRHIARYFGYLVLPCTRDQQAGYIAIKTYYTPTIGVTLIAPSTIRDQQPSITSWTISDAENIASVSFQNAANTTVLAFPLFPHNNLTGLLRSFAHLSSNVNPPYQTTIIYPCPSPPLHPLRSLLLHVMPC